MGLREFALSAPSMVGLVVARFPEVWRQWPLEYSQMVHFGRVKQLAKRNFSDQKGKT